MSEEIIEWYWDCVDSNNPTGLSGFFESQTINVANLFNDEGLNGLHKAAKEGFLEIAKILVGKRKIDVDFPAKRNQWTPLHFACSNNRREIIDFLLDEAANTEIVSKDHKSAYDVSSPEMKEFILNYRADLARKEKIVQLCQEQTFDELKWRLFIQNNPGFSLNRSCNKDGWNALVYAAYYGKPDIIDFLFNHCQVELNHKDKAGRTALHWACASNQFAAIKILIDAGADIDAQDMNGRTVLIQAVADKSTYIVDLLLEYTPSMEVKDRWGYTALTGCQNADIKLKLKEYMRERREGVTPKAAQPRTPHSGGHTPATPSHKNSLTTMSFDGEASMMNMQFSAEMEKLKEEIKRQEEELKRQREAMAMKDQIDSSRVVKMFREALPAPVFRMYDAALFGRFENFSEQVARFDASEKSKYIIKSIRDMQAPFQGQFDADTLGEHQVQLAMFVTSLSNPAPEAHHPAPALSRRDPSFIAPSPAAPSAPAPTQMANNTIHLSSPLSSAAFSSDRAVVIPAELNRLANGRVTKSKVYVKLANSAEGVSRSQKEKELLAHLSKTSLFVQCEGIFFPSSIVTHDGYILSALPDKSQKITAGLALEPGLENLEAHITNNSPEDNNFFKLADIATQVANIVLAVHNSNLIWSDVKPSNIVLFAVDNKQRWKGIDVESALWQEDATYPPDFLFTPTFLAPEVAHSILHSKPLQPSVKIDSWSVGLLYLWLFKRTGSNPLIELGLHGNKEHVLQVLDNAKDLQVAINKLIESTFSEAQYAGLKHVLKALLDVDPQQRWALDAVKRKGFFQGSATVNRSAIEIEIRDELRSVKDQLHDIQTSIKELSKNLNQQFEGCNRNFALTLRDMGHQLLSQNGEMASQLSDLRASINNVLDVSKRNPAELKAMMAGFQDTMCQFVSKSIDNASAQNQLHLTKTMAGYDMNMKHYFEEMNRTLESVDFNQTQNQELLEQSVANLVILRDQMNTMQASMDKMTEKVDTCHVMLNQMMVVTVKNNIDINNAMSELGDLMKNRTKHLEDALKSQKGQSDAEMAKLFNSTFDRLTTNIAGIFQDIQEDNTNQMAEALEENKRALAGMESMFTSQITDMKSMLNSEAPQFSLILEGMKSIKDDIQKVQVEVQENKQQMQEGFSRMAEFARKQEKMLQAVLLNNHDMPGLFMIVPQAPTTWSKFNPRNWAFNRCKLFFICPVTLTIAGSGKDGGGYAFDVPKDWVKVVAPAVCVGLILVKVGLACSGIPVPIPIPNFKDLGAMDFLDNVLSHVGSLDSTTSKICDAAVAAGKTVASSKIGQTVATDAAIVGKGVIAGGVAVGAAAGAVGDFIAKDNYLDDVVTDTASFLSDNGAAVAKGFSEVKNLLVSKALDNFPQPKFTGLVQVLAKDGSNAWVHSSVAAEFFEKGQSMIKKTSGAFKA